MSLYWSHEDQKAAVAEGWFFRAGSVFAIEYATASTREHYRSTSLILNSDTEAYEHVMNGTSPLHEKARALLVLYMLEQT